jgi:hypothetical protein
VYRFPDNFSAGIRCVLTDHLAAVESQFQHPEALHHVDDALHPNPGQPALPPSHAVGKIPDGLSAGSRLTALAELSTLAGVVRWAAVSPHRPLRALPGFFRIMWF